MHCPQSRSSAEDNPKKLMATKKIIHQSAMMLGEYGKKIGSIKNKNKRLKWILAANIRQSKRFQLMDGMI
jgi:hypothetical protein